MNFKTVVPVAVLFFTVVIFISCDSGKNNTGHTLFELQRNTGINFENTLQDSKEFNVFKYRNFYDGGGVATGDINNDGLPDIFFTGNQVSNKLYLNKGNFTFEDISVKAGFTEKKQWSTGVTFVDINNDGWLDIYVCNAGNMLDSTLRRNQLFINNHDLTFTESAARYGLDNAGYSIHASFFDYDMDGDLDCFIINNSPIPVNTLNYANKRDLPVNEWKLPDFLKGGGDHLYRNDEGKFVEVTREAGIHGSLISLGLGVTVDDVNGDNYPDIYVSNDFFERDYLYINQKNGTFKDELEGWLEHTSLSSMGADIADINNDGFPDIFTTDMLPGDEYRLKTTTSFDSYNVEQLKQRSGFYRQYMQNTLQLNNRNGKFFDIAYFGGVATSDWSWGAMMFDADNDGFTDIYVCNGIARDITDQDFIDFFANDIIQDMALSGRKEEINSIIDKMPTTPVLNKFYRNKGNLKFDDIGEKWGISQPSFSNGASYADLDNDGDLDLLINNVNGPAFIYRNNSHEQGKNHYIGFKLSGSNKNTFAIGTYIKVYADSQVLSRTVMPSRGFQSSIDYKVEVGLGNIPKIDSVLITWPDLMTSRLYNPPLDTVLAINQKTAADKQTGIIAENKTLLKNVPVNFEKHKEDAFVDFYMEQNLPRSLSKQGPVAACGDIDKDGLEDIYIGGAAGQGGQLYVQKKNGFFKKEQQVFTKFIQNEDGAAVFFDADGDNDLDLYVGTGGNNMPPNNAYFRHRLYKNDGKGNFSWDSLAFPPNESNISIAIPYDFDKDGDLDLFIGGRNVSYFYGKSPRSYLMVNDGKGHFTDMTNSISKEIADIGMVTGAAWANITGDSDKELVITGEWMCPRVFSYSNNQFREVVTNLKDLFGWWQTISAADFDNNGYDDLIIGNIGENFYLSPGKDTPVKLWMNDYDQNGSIDKILTRTVKGKDMPVFLKKEITDQIPGLKKQNLKYAQYASKSIQDLFSPALIAKSTVKQFNYPSSIIAMNDGKGNFTVNRLPDEVQFSSVNTATCIDLNGDKMPDLVLGGNIADFLPQFGRLDASEGHVLLNLGKGIFQYIDPAGSGLKARGITRNIVILNGMNKQYIIFLENNDFPLVYEINE
ncbi:MAG: VCBS repeat-containing protein [Bacteroidota bacterium]